MHTHTRKPIGQRLLSAITLIAMVLGMVTFASPRAVQADTVGGQVFLQGNYVEVGIHSNGYFGTSQNAPAGYHPIGRTQLGFVADFGMDGWGVGSPPQSGDYFMPGTHEQGFAVKWGTYIANNNGSGSLAQIAPTSLTETSFQSEAVWVGQATSGADTLQVTRRVTTNPNDLFFTIYVELHNTGSTTLSSVKYLENVDPDNDKDLSGGSYTTDNYIVYQPGVYGNPSIAQVAAVGTVYNNVAVRLSTNDSRARVSVGGFAVRDPDVVLSAPACTPNGSTVCNTAPGVVTRDDIAISLAYNLGDLAPGQSATFQYRYMLSDIATNNPPVAVDDTYTTTQSTPLTVVAPGVLENDADTDGDPLTAVKDTDPTNGTVTLNADGSFIYTPTVGFSGGDSFTYHANDGQDDSNVATVTIDVVATDTTVQIDFRDAFNADVVENTGDPEEDEFDPTGARMITQAVAEANVPGDDDKGMNNNGVYPANSEHPEVVLIATDDFDGYNAWKAYGIQTENFAVNPTGQYNEVHIFASAGGAGPTTPAKFRMTMHYSDGSSTTSSEITVPDWFGNVSAPGYYLIDGMDRFQNPGYEDADTVAIFGFPLLANPTKTLESITIEITDNSAGSFVFFGATATTVSTVDTDGDGIPDGDDIDDDNDGIPDSVEMANAPANGDTDGDGIPDHRDLDSDNDGINDVHEAGGTDADGDGMHDGAQGELTTPPDTDGDGQPDYVDLDSDNDAISDLVEGGSGATDADNDGVADGPDADGDGIVDSADDNDALFGEDGDTGPQDTDTDGDPDYVDLDSDGDGTDDIDEPGGNSGLDGNNDGRIDDATDNDNDGIADIIDEDDNNFGGLGDIDTDGDGIPNAQDIDDDNDGIPDSVEIANAPANGGDTDGDGIPDHLDLDSDNDGINDVHEAGGADADGDGMHDGTQGELTTPPDTDGDGQPDYIDLDSDNDSISDLVEGGSGAIDLNHDGVADGPDADGDGIVDSADDNDALFGENNDPGPRDTDGDGDPDYVDRDSDGDGTDDIDEAGNGDLDADNDGDIDDATDNDNDGIADVIDDDDNNFGGLGDTDGDGIIDSLDLDDDNDGIPDSVEIANAPANGDTDGDGIPDHRDLDSDNDGINDVHEAGGTDADGDGMHDGAQGELTTPPDTDGDGQPDYVDLDSDNDSVSDLVEGGSGATDANNDGVADGPDADGDGIVDSADDNDAVFGENNDPGPQDSDGDGDPDYVDPDSDGDGTDDIDEAGNGGLDADNDGDIDDDTDADKDGIADIIDDDDANFGGLGADTTAPAPVTVTAPISGTITNDNTPTFVGTGEPGADITIYDDEGGIVCTTTVNPDGSWSCTPTTPLDEGAKTYEVTQTDAAGNESDPTPVTITIDTTVPAPVTVTVPISGTVTNDNTPTFTGTGEAGAEIKVYDDEDNVVCTTTVDLEGNWSCTPTTPLPEGEQTFEVTQTDAAGNESAPVQVAITVDTIAPAPPVITAPSEGATTGARPTFTGTAEPGSIVRVEEVVGTITYVICQAVTDAEGNWTCTATAPLSAGEHTVKAISVDEAGNESAPDEVTFTVAPVEAQDDAYNVPEGVGSTLDVLENDSSASGGDIAIVAVGTPAHGVATINGDTIVYTPTAGYLGSDSFNYTINDGTSEDTAQVTVTVSPVADLAVAQTVRGSITGLEFTLVARNLGPRPASGAVISDTFPPSLGNITWTCVAAGGAACPNASGTGHIEETLATFPAGGVITYTVSAQFVVLSVIENNTVTITPPAGMFDLVLSNNSATRPTLYRIILPLIFRNATP